MYEYRAYYGRVVDGDTIELDVDLGFGVMLRNQSFRLFGIDCPESRLAQYYHNPDLYVSPQDMPGVTDEQREKLKWAGTLASTWVKDKLSFHTNRIRIITYKDAAGKYGRMLASVFCDNDELSLNQQLVENFLAVDTGGAPRRGYFEEHWANVEQLLADPKLGRIDG